jgi:cholesterol transport system auxiliary component
MKRRVFTGALAAAALAGCNALPEKPTRQVMYDLGPSPAPAGPVPQQAPALVLRDVDAEGILETTAVLYRLAYEDAHQLRPYAFARWSAPPPQLVGQRLREVLGRDRVVLDTSASAAMARRGNERPPMLRVELEEFSQVFDAPGSSRGVLRLRCTLLEVGAGAARPVAQRSFELARPAPTADAAGGVRALTAAATAAAEDIVRWLQQP